jgi:hypothetical protein
MKYCILVEFYSKDEIRSKFNGIGLDTKPSCNEDMSQYFMKKGVYIWCVFNPSIYDGISKCDAIGLTSIYNKHGDKVSSYTFHPSWVKNIIDYGKYKDRTYNGFRFKTIFPNLILNNKRNTCNKVVSYFNELKCSFDNKVSVEVFHFRELNNNHWENRYKFYIERPLVLTTYQKVFINRIKASRDVVIKPVKGLKNIKVYLPYKDYRKLKETNLYKASGYLTEAGKKLKTLVDSNEDRNVSVVKYLLNIRS